MSDLVRKCSECSDDLDQFGNCWKCANKQLKLASKTLKESFTEEQWILWRPYDEANNRLMEMRRRDNS